MLENIWSYIVNSMHSVNFLTWVLLFFISIIYDIVYTKSILHISRLDALKAANLSVLLYLMMAYGTINYVKNVINLIPIALGAWFGTYMILKYEQYIKDKKKKLRDKK